MSLSSPAAPLSSRRLKRLPLALLLAGSAHWLPVQAATEAAPAATSDSQLKTVTVTARRREESAQDVPTPMSVLDGQALALHFACRPIALIAEAVGLGELALALALVGLEGAFINRAIGPAGLAHAVAQPGFPRPVIAVAIGIGHLAPAFGFACNDSASIA